jgi:hypothetical protein
LSSKFWLIGDWSIEDFKKILKVFFAFDTLCREVVNEFEMKQLKDRVSLAMCACDSANKLKVRTVKILTGKTSRIAG